MRLAILCLVSSVAHADATLPGEEPALSSDENEVAVRSLPDEGTLSLTMDESSFAGCSRSFHSTQSNRKVTLELKRDSFTLSSDGTRAEHRGGWDPANNRPRAGSSTRGTIAWRASGRAERHDGVLELAGKTAAGEAVTVRCQLRSVERALPDGQSAGHLSALVCDVPANSAFANDNVDEKTVALPLGRTTRRVDGLRTSLRAHRFARPAITVAPLLTGTGS